MKPTLVLSCAMAPVGYQWFAIDPMGGGDRLAGVRSAAPVLERFIDAELSRLGLSEAELLLAGFSQGTMMALHVGLRRAGQVAGILGYSGLLAGPEVLAEELTVRPPVLLVHGDSDELLPVERLHEAVAGLGAAGFAWLDDWMGSKPTVLISLGGLILFGAATLATSDATVFIALALALGLFVGPAQAASRSLMARLSPKHLETEMFGLYALTGKVKGFEDLARICQRVRALQVAGLRNA